MDWLPMYTPKNVSAKAKKNYTIGCFVNSFKQNAASAASGGLIHLQGLRILKISGFNGAERF
jgi:hypothetical protein